MTPFAEAGSTEQASVAPPRSAAIAGSRPVQLADDSTRREARRSSARRCDACLLSFADVSTWAEHRGEPVSALDAFQLGQVRIARPRCKTPAQLVALGWRQDRFGLWTQGDRAP